MFLAPIKTVLVWIYAASFIVYSAAGTLIIRDSKKRMRFILHSKRLFSMLALRMLGIRMHADYSEIRRINKPVLLISNHVSYVDILILAVLYPAVFVAAVEWAKAPFVGWIARLGASIFIRRLSHAGIHDEIDTIARTLHQQFSVILFPEATSSDGRDLLPFKSPFFAVAQHANAPVVPVCIRYTKINGKPVTDNNRNRIHFYRPMNFFFHALGVPFLKSVDVRVKFLEPVDREAWHTRKELARICEERIRAAYSED